MTMFADPSSAGAAVLNLLSLLTFAAGLAYVFVTWRKKRFSSRLLLLTVTEIVAIFLVELAVVLEKNGVRSGLLIDTMQAFSLDSSYEAVSSPVTVFAEACLNRASHYYRILLYSLAPVVGGAVIYDVLAGISPEVHMFFVQCSELYVFSELNEKTVTLAEDIWQENAKKPAFSRPHLVFTDCYTTAGEEEESELLQRAKELRAVCLKDDLLHCGWLRNSRHCSFFLMDLDKDGALDDLSNVGALRGLLDTKPFSWNEKKGCTVFIVSNSSETVENIRSVKANYDKVASKKAGPVKVHVVRDYAQTCCYHLHDHPLFEGLTPVGEEERGAGSSKVLDLLILGWTPFAREMFKTLFWLGQMLDYSLRITVVAPPSGSSESKTLPQRELERFCPELLASCRPRDPSLRIRLKDDSFSAPYASLCFLEADLFQLPLDRFLTKPRRCQFGDRTEFFTLANVDRCFVMAGRDEENIALADELRRALVYLQADGSARGGMRVDLLVENPDMHRVIERRFLKDKNEEKCVNPPDMQLFGRLKDRYRRDFFALDGAFVAEQTAPGGEDAYRHALPDISASQDDIYNDWSRIARAFHMPVKMFCYGITGESEYDRKLKYVEKMYQDSTKPGFTNTDRLRWLEHRRWCAFLRTEGFRTPPGLAEKLAQVSKLSQEDLDALSKYIRNLEKNADLETRITAVSALELKDWQRLRLYSHKDVPARLHPCLVECLDYNNGPVEGKDLLDLVADLRTVVLAGEKAYPAPQEEKSKEEKKKSNAPEIRKHTDLYEKKFGKKLGSLKKYDSPYGEAGPTLNRAETYRFMTGREMPGVDDGVLWAELLKRWPELERCQRSADCGRYCVDLLMDYKKESEEKAKEGTGS